MKLPKLTKGDVVCIDWHDTNIPYETGWMTEEEFIRFVNSDEDMVRSVGIFVTQNKRFLHLAGDTDLFFVTKKVAYLRPICIGKGYIEKIRILKKKRGGGCSPRP